MTPRRTNRVALRHMHANGSKVPLGQGHVEGSKAIKTFFLLRDWVAVWSKNVQRHQGKLGSTKVENVLANFSGICTSQIHILFGQWIRHSVGLIFTEASVLAMLPVLTVLVVVACLLASHLRLCEVGVVDGWEEVFPLHGKQHLLIHDLEALHFALGIAMWALFKRLASGILGPATKTSRLLIKWPSIVGIDSFCCRPNPLNRCVQYAPLKWSSCC
mmetsp:Transcript_3791/g.9661  ORF Transcript_3791/g.9661 Transcript_3791/m.9661 type:complete len:216 (-) Transcript_3791:111-758(-)